MRLLLIRHGETAANRDHLLDTAAPGSALTPGGLRQAAALPALLAAAGEDVRALYASPLPRARGTAAPLAAALGLEVRLREGLRELAAGAYEGRGDDDAVGAYLRTAVAWASGRTGLRMPGGEDGAEFLARYDAVVAEAAGCGSDTVAVVAHGTAFRVWTAARVANVSVEFATAHEVPNGGVVVLEGDPGSGWRALSWSGAAVPAGGAEARAGAGVSGRG
ncbi:histidine phosphatase family protein [Streptomyces sp. NPDC048337]|uniref:histidine phosphatase family protein n=1 Tax=Streptomyces sp. NPDC048337 TaxID=3365535 RepID=UPI0037127B0A